VAARPYAQRMNEVVSELATRAGEAHPLLERREPKRVAMVLLTSDRGLCGAFNLNLCRRVERFIIDNSDRFQSVELYIVGRKGKEYFPPPPVAQHQDPPRVARRRQRRRGRRARARDHHASVLADFVVLPHPETGEVDTSRRVDAIYLVYNEFKSAISQTVAIEPCCRSPPPPSTTASATATSSTSPPARSCSPTSCRSTCSPRSTAPSSRASPPSSARA